MSLTDKEVQSIAQQVAEAIGQHNLQQGTQQGSQQVGEQIGKAIAQSLSEQSVQGSTQEKSNVVDSTTQNKQEEILGGESLRAAVVSNTRLWNANEKYIFEKSQDYDRILKNLEVKEKELAIAEREAKLRHQVKLDSIEVSEKENNALVKHLANTLLVDFRTAAYHPISPNDQDKDAKISRK